MGVLGVVVVVGAIEVGGHHGDIVGAILAVEELAVFQSRDLRQGIGLVGLFQLACEQTALSHRLWRKARIDATGAEEEEFLAAVLPSRVDDVHLEDHVVVHKIRESGLIGNDAADLGGSEEDVFGLLSGKELLYRFLATEVQLRMGAGDDMGVA